MHHAARLEMTPARPDLYVAEGIAGLALPGRMDAIASCRDQARCSRQAAGNTGGI
jgi:hypothetical protein